MGDPADLIFFETTRRFAPPGLARSDVDQALALAQVPPGAPIADLGCGYGRHLRAFVERGYAPLGIDRSALLLAEASREVPRARLLRADLRALPLHNGVLAAGFCFYSSMFLGTHDDAVQALREAARVLRASGSLVLTTDNPLRLEARSEFQDDVPGLGRVVEESTFDARENVDTITKRIELPAGRKLSATFVIRYYAPPSLAQLAREAGLELVRLDPDEALTRDSPQMVALLEKVR